MEQFHQLYESSSSINDQHQLEEIYVMGFRIISFLTECLPQHPGLSKAPMVQEQSKEELKHLRKCLEDVALRIDECVCNDFVDDGDNFLDSMIAQQMEKEEADESKKSWSSSSDEELQLESWVDFNEFKKLEESTSDRQKERKLSESPTSETVGTTGTGSVEAVDSSDTKSNSSENSKSEEESVGRRRRKSKKEKVEVEDLNSVIRDDDFSDKDYPPHWDDESLTSYSSRPMTLLRKSVSLDFLKTIACEPVLYETDSEAADSWANGEDNTVNSRSRPCLPSSSGVTPTSDPARLAFRNLMNKLPHKSILQRDAKQPESPIDPRSPRSTVTRVVSPTFSDIMEERDTQVISIDDDSLDQVVENEIQIYLDQTLGKQDKRRGKLNKNMRSRREQQSGSLDGKVRKQESRRGRQEREANKQEQQQRLKQERPRQTMEPKRMQQEQQQRVKQERPRQKMEPKTVVQQEQNRGKLAQKLGSDTKVRSALRSRSRDSSSRGSGKKSVSFDDSSASSSSTNSVSTATTATPTSAYTSLASLRRKTGSQTSAFSAYSGTKQKQNKQQEPKPFDEDDEDWMNFESGSSFFN